MRRWLGRAFDWWTVAEVAFVVAVIADIVSAGIVPSV